MLIAIPVLFTIYINNTTSSNTKCNTHLYADDTLLYCCVNCTENCFDCPRFSCFIVTLCPCVWHHAFLFLLPVFFRFFFPNLSFPCLAHLYLISSLEYPYRIFVLPQFVPSFPRDATMCFPPASSPASSPCVSLWYVSSFCSLLFSLNCTLLLFALCFSLFLLLLIFWSL